MVPCDRNPLGISSRKGKIFPICGNQFTGCECTVCDGHRDTSQPALRVLFSWVEPGAWIFSCPAHLTEIKTNEPVIARAPQTSQASPKASIHRPPLLSWSSTTTSISRSDVDSPQRPTHGENLLCLLAGSQAGSNIINAYLHPLPSSPRLARRAAYLGAARGHARMPPPASSRNISSPLSILSPPPCSSARTGHVSGGVSTHCAALLFPPPSPPTPQQQTRPNLYPKPQESTSLRFFQHFSVASRRAGLLRHHYPLILIDKGEN